MLNHHGHTGASTQLVPGLRNPELDKPSTAVAASSATSTVLDDAGDPASTAMPQPRPTVGEPVAPEATMDRAAAWLMFGLTLACFGFLGYLVTIDRADLASGVPATVGIVVAINAVVFRKHTVVQRNLRRMRRTTAAIARTLTELLETDTGPGERK
ncbi:hypothetical protein [Nocardia amamiensis]|uniref:hypothetical protein n=1 Tax=Nocardia amamiensis TaxID=404578 RepID=UPI000834BCA9|nr:hypothetical protein [Nocardia amamiensis]